MRAHHRPGAVPGSEGPSIVVRQPGASTTVQDHPGRLGYWMVGVPPSGPMDDLSHRLVNRVVGNAASAAALECTATGPTLELSHGGVVCVGGADMGATLDGRPIPLWEPIEVRPGQVLALDRVRGAGLRTYVAVRGGLDVPVVLGSRSTFTLGRFGGVDGRTLMAGDVLPVGTDLAPGLRPSPLGPGARPLPTREWTIGVLEGPHAAPDFFTPDDVDAFFAAEWQVQIHCARTGVRLDGPKPTWARRDGGEAGLHPSNIHDTGYAFGTVDFTGDTPVLLGPDGPSLGGFTCPATVATGERWKLGQLAPGDRVRFVPLDGEQADAVRRRHAAVGRTLRAPASEVRLASRRDPASGVLHADPGGVDRPALTVRRSGDAFVVVEYGAMQLDLALRARVHALDAWLAAHAPDAVVDVTAGVRSLLVQFEPDAMSLAEVLDLVTKGDDELPPTHELSIDARTVHLPLSWQDPAVLEAVRRYTEVVRNDAPWCPSNLEFIRRINGLSSTDDVHRIVHEARYLVLGLGDVYLGAPVATPLDPRHRLVTTKYNPARTWTPENAVGIGGAYLCVYGMEGPGGYQLVGRTVPVWSLGRHAQEPTPGDEPDVPWLLRPFDQIVFSPVEADELLDLRAAAQEGELPLRIEPTTFSLADYEANLAAAADEIAAFRSEQRAAFEAERADWKARGEI